MNALSLPRSRRLPGGSRLLGGALGLLLIGVLSGPVGADSASSTAPATTTTAPQDVFQGVARVVAIGDIHGDFERLQQVLRLCKLTDDKDQWIGGKAHLVQTGDVLD